MSPLTVGVSIGIPLLVLLVIAVASAIWFRRKWNGRRQLVQEEEPGVDSFRLLDQTAASPGQIMELSHESGQVVELSHGTPRIPELGAG